MNDKIYVVYNQYETYPYEDDYAETTYNLFDRYFTSEDKANDYAEYLFDYEDRFGGEYFATEVICGDDIDVAPLIEAAKQRRLEREIQGERMRRINEVENLALYHSRVTGSDYGDNLRKFKEEYADYIHNGREENIQ